MVGSAQSRQATDTTADADAAPVVPGGDDDDGCGSAESTLD